MDYRLSHLSKGEDYDYDLSIGDFNTFMADHEKQILLSIVPKLFPKKVPRYLDFACGTGRITQLLENLTDTSYGVDVSQKMLGQARRKCSRTNFILGDATRKTLDINPVNLVTAFRFLGNAQDELRLGALNAINHLLFEGGYLIINNHRNPWSLRNIFHRIRRDIVTEDLHYIKLRRLLNKSGFRIVGTKGIGFWLYRDKLYQANILNSSFARCLEIVCKIPILPPFCPDLIIVAQKMKNGSV